MILKKLLDRQDDLVSDKTVQPTMCEVIES